MLNRSTLILMIAPTFALLGLVGCATVTPEQLAKVQALAEQASAKADKAQSTADQALSRANAAQSNAAQALSKADSGQAAANQALQAANDAEAVSARNLKKEERMLDKAMQK